LFPLQYELLEANTAYAAPVFVEWHDRSFSSSPLTTLPLLCYIEPSAAGGFPTLGRLVPSSLSMQKGPPMKLATTCPRFALVLILIAGVAVSCCPSGVWKDNFGVTYQLLTDFFHPEGDSLPILGLADTGELGCGLWTVEGLSNATGPDRSISLTLINPKPSPDDRCCYFFHFTGHLQGSGCLFIAGDYETNDGKCTQSGQMYLYSLR